MNKVYSIISALFLLCWTSCTDNADNPTSASGDRIVVFSLSMPEDERPQTRAQLVEKDFRNYSVKWKYGDVITLFFEFNNKFYTSEGKVISMSSSGKTAKFSAQIPDEVNEFGVYRVYGVSGKGGRILSNNPQVYVSLFRTTPDDFNVPVWFSAVVTKKWPDNIVCSHMGAYEILHFKNKTANTVSVTFSGFKTDNPWYYDYAVYNPLEDKLLSGVSYVPMSELNHDVVTARVPTESTVQFQTWYIPTGEKMKDAVLEMIIDGNPVTAVNTKSSDVTINKGNAYHLYATWDGEQLVQGLTPFTDRLRLSTSALTMSLDDEASVDVLSGNGFYSVSSSDETIAAAYVKNGRAHIYSAFPGEADITVKDDFTSETKTVRVTVVVSENNLYGRIMRDMILVEPGTFMMGDPDNKDNFSSPAHEVTLTRPYYIGKFEVTRKLYHEVMSGNTDVENPDCAVGSMMWYQVREFFTQLNKKTGKYFRLPSNAEWEFAARGGNYSRGYIHSGSNVWSEVANRDFIDYSNPVGTKRPNELGIYDMSGGMVEWVEDYYYEYTSDPETNPRHKDDGAYVHITRWAGERSYSHVWYWLPYEGPASCRSDFGFRIVLSPDDNLDW
ncbi:MAG: SUMF1/EgtB/PvdO family nonheme iron enzyme [Prevotella sp.]|nr:SUMF1/EgtB/PvdO family nonheme iron enzyme [Prevotella sp.]